MKPGELVEIKGIQFNQERFWAKVQKTSGCWIWTACKRKGQFPYGYFNTKIDGKWKREKAARVAWTLTHKRRIPDGKCICHHCDNPVCVRPSHLYLGDKGTNYRDCVRRGRDNKARGEDAHLAKLTWGEVHEIRNLWDTGWSQRKLAAKFNTSRRNVRAILARHSWRPEWERKE